MGDISWLSRTELLVGKEKLMKLQNSHVLVVGMGGVGSFAAEFICRAGVGEMTIVDGDVVDPSNRNRQLPALSTTHGLSKADVMAERLLAINPDLKLHVIKEFITPDRAEQILSTPFDYVVDAIDSITPKVTFLKIAYQKKIKIISSMGAGAKLDPTMLQVVDISKTDICPFAQYVRKRLREIGIYEGIKTVFSPELPIKESLMLTDGKNFKKSAYGTISYLPATFGSVCASVVIRDLIEIKPPPIEKILETERLYLRQFTIKDAQLLINLNRDINVTRYTGDVPVKNLEEARHILTDIILPQYPGKIGRWAVHLKSSNEFIGWCGLKYLAEADEFDLGYRFFKKQWGKGYATESAKAVMEYGVNKLKLKNIVARAAKENTASIHVIKKLGFVYLEDEMCAHDPAEKYIFPEL
jgi:tRNA A37 threonylcarbamoyladenosine dehydratase